MGMNVEIKGKKLVITMDVEKATPSASGKTMVVASTRGNQETKAQVNGKNLIIGLNAYYRP